MSLHQLLLQAPLKASLHNLFHLSKTMGLSKSGKAEKHLSELSIDKIVDCKFGELSIRLVTLQNNSGVKAEIARSNIQTSY